MQRLQDHQTPIEKDLSHQVVSAQALAAVFSPTADTSTVAKLLATKYNTGSKHGLVAVFLRTGLPGTSLATCLHTLRHTVIVVRGLASTDLIVDPNFRSQFHIPHAPPAFHAFLSEHVPAVMVGTEARVRVMVDTLADVVAAVYRQQDDATLPPWRKRTALLSKFLPAVYEDVVVLGDDDDTLAAATGKVGGDRRAMCNALMDGMSSLIVAARRSGKQPALKEEESPRSVFLPQVVAA